MFENEKKPFFKKPLLKYAFRCVSRSSRIMEPYMVLYISSGLKEVGVSNPVSSEISAPCYYFTKDPKNFLEEFLAPIYTYFDGGAEFQKTHFFCQTLEKIATK